MIEAVWLRTWLRAWVGLPDMEADLQTLQKDQTELLRLVSTLLPSSAPATPMREREDPMVDPHMGRL